MHLLPLTQFIQHFYFYIDISDSFTDSIDVCVWIFLPNYWVNWAQNIGKYFKILFNLKSRVLGTSPNTESPKFVKFRFHKTSSWFCNDSKVPKCPTFCIDRETNQSVWYNENLSTILSEIVRQRNWVLYLQRVCWKSYLEDF